MKVILDDRRHFINNLFNGEAIAVNNRLTIPKMMIAWQS